MIISFLITGGSIVRYYSTKQAKEKMRKIEQEVALERERLRIARDIHDDLGSRLTEIQLLSEMAFNGPEKKAASALHEVSEIAKKMISTFSEIVWSVNPQNDTVENLAEYIGQYAVDYLSKAQIKCRLDLPQEFPNLKASSEIRHNVFLAVKEALNNAVKHSETNVINLKVEVIDFSAVFFLHDYGKGFEILSRNKFGNGLINMEMRMEQLGGNFEIESTIGTGTTITFTVPLMKN
jgi:signal transduction histidine kinase